MCVYKKPRSGRGVVCRSTRTQSMTVVACVILLYCSAQLVFISADAYRVGQTCMHCPSVCHHLLLFLKCVKAGSSYEQVAEFEHL